jgi:hypothetical protein
MVFGLLLLTWSVHGNTSHNDQIFYSFIGLGLLSLAWGQYLRSTHTSNFITIRAMSRTAIVVGVIFILLGAGELLYQHY